MKAEGGRQVKSSIDAHPSPPPPPATPPSLTTSSRPGRVVLLVLVDMRVDIGAWARCRRGEGGTEGEGGVDDGGGGIRTRKGGGGISPVARKR